MEFFRENFGALCSIVFICLEEIIMPEPIEITKMKENYSNREYVLNAVSQQGELLDFAEDSFKDDKEIVLAAIASNPEALEFVSDRLKSDREVVYNSVSKAGWTYCYTGEKLLKDKELLISALKVNRSNTILCKFKTKR